MLSKEDNDRYNNVEPGSPLHEMARRYWLPYLRSESLAAGGPPRKVELLGEQFVSFRADNGAVGFLDEQCPHRGASLSLGRSGDNAITCIFHGWKFDVSGQCIGALSESNPKFCSTVRARAWPVREAGGVLWVYLGAGEPPVFPEWEFCSAPPEHRRARVGYTDSNWTQNLETLLDSAHIGILHAEPVKQEVNQSVSNIKGINAPKLSVLETPYGLQAYSRRERGDGKVYLRVTEFIAPFTVLNGTTREEESRVLFMIPINNRRTAFWRLEWDLNRTQEWWRSQSAAKGVLGLKFVDHDDFLANSLDRTRTDFGQNRAAMALGHWSGFKDLRAEDAAVAESVPIVDRTREHLGASDLVIAKMRQQFFRGLSEFERGGPALGLGPEGNGSGISYADLRGSSEVIGSDVDQVDFHNRVLRDERRARREAFLAAWRKAA
ncbi:MAG: Rieske 2Fe-2S domain-containing protein [Burkholderiaceae bacterium]